MIEVVNCIGLLLNLAFNNCLKIQKNKLYFNKVVCDHAKLLFSEYFSQKICK